MNRWGIWTLDELTASGVPPSTVHTRARRGAYRRLLPQVYALAPPTALALCLAVTRWRPEVVLSHRTAAWLWGMLPEPSVVEVTVPLRISVRAPEWIVVHRRELAPAAITSSWSMPVVTPERALLDCAAVLTPDELEPVVDEQLSVAVNLHTLAERLAQDGGMWGAPAARDQLRLAVVGAASEPERLLARALHRRGYRLEVNPRLLGYRVDLLARGARVVVEVDGREFHSAPGVFVADRVRQNVLVRDGWLVLRFAAAQVLADPDAVAAEIIAVLRLRRRSRARLMAGSPRARAEPD